jgi:PAS domain S-box-containing protein
MPRPIRVLILEERRDDARRILDQLRTAGFEPTGERVETEADFLARLDPAPELILADFLLPQFDALHALRLVQERNLDVPLIVVTYALGEEAAVDCLNRGADDYLLKDRLDRLGQAVTDALRRKEVRDARRRAEEAQRRAHHEMERRFEERATELARANQDLRAEIIERTRAEQAMRESVDRVRLLLDSTGEAIFGLDQDGLCTFCNAACLRLLGYAGSHDLLGKNMHRLVHHTRADGTPYPQEECRIFRAFRQGEGAHVEDEVLWRTDGTCFPAEYWSYPVRRGGQVSGTVVTFVDITERKRAGEALRQSEQRLRLALDAGGMGTWDWDIRADEVVWSDNLGAVVGLPPGSFDGTLEGFRRLIHPDDRDFVGSAITNAIEERSGYEVEFRIARPDGSIGWMLGKGRVFTDGDGEPMRMIGVSMDITDRKRAGDDIFVLNAELEGRLERIEALREIDRAITGSLDLRFTLGVVLDQVVGQLEVDAAAVLLCRPHQVTLEYAARKGYRGPSPTGDAQRLDEGPAGRAVLEGRTQHLPGPAGEPGALPGSARAEGFVSYWAVPLVAKGRINGVLEVGHRSELDPDPEWLEFLETLAGQAAIAVDNATLFEGLRRSNLELSLAYDATIEGWSRAMDLRDRETEGHSRRVTEMTLRLARAMDLDEAELVHVRRGALLHDIGKLGIPDAILQKPGKLTDEDWQVMRGHSTLAYEMLSPISFLRPALEIPYCHHEKWDGTGYPRGLKGEQIPLSARIFAAVDIWDAMRSDRPYRKGWPEERVREHIARLSGTHLDPDVVQAFLRHVHPPEPTASVTASADGSSATSPTMVSEPPSIRS